MKPISVIYKDTEPTFMEGAGRLKYAGKYSIKTPIIRRLYGLNILDTLFIGSFREHTQRHQSILDALFLATET